MRTALASVSFAQSKGFQDEKYLMNPNALRTRSQSQQGCRCVIKHSIMSGAFRRVRSISLNAKGNCEDPGSVLGYRGGPHERSLQESCWPPPTRTLPTALL